MLDKGYMSLEHAIHQQNQLKLSLDALSRPTIPIEQRLTAEDMKEKHLVASIDPNIGYTIVRRPIETSPDIVYISDFYSQGEKIDDTNLPSTLRRVSKEKRDQYKQIKPAPIVWAPGRFSNDLLHSKYSRNLKQVLSKNGANTKKVKHLIELIKPETGVMIFNAGYVLVFPQYGNYDYVFKINTGSKKDFYNIYRPKR